jgi:D-alanine-D-alanine ligase
VSRVAVLYGGPSPEHDISILTGLPACRALVGAGRDPVSIYWTKQGSFVLVDPDLEAFAFLDGTPKGAEPVSLIVGPHGGFAEAGRLGRPRPLDLDTVILCTHGGPGEDGTLQGVLDLAGVAYTGPSVPGAALGMDKLAFTAAMALAGVATLPRVDVDESTTSLPFDPPFIVKPRFGGSSIGVHPAGDLATLTALCRTSPHLRAGAVAEPFRPDLDDLQVAVRRYPALEVSPIERPTRAPGGEILNYTDKYAPGEGMAAAPRQLPALGLSRDTEAEIRTVAQAVAGICLVRGIARVDFLFGDGQLYVNEINTIPGSLSRHLFGEPPCSHSFVELLDDLVAETRAVPTGRYLSVGADGTVLRSAGAIASKLA